MFLEDEGNCAIDRLANRANDRLPNCANGRYGAYFISKFVQENLIGGISTENDFVRTQFIDCESGKWAARNACQKFNSSFSWTGFELASWGTDPGCPQAWQAMWNYFRGHPYMTSELYLGYTTPSPLSVPNSHKLPCFDLDLGNLSPPSLLTSFMDWASCWKNGVITTLPPLASF